MFVILERLYFPGLNHFGMTPVGLDSIDEGKKLFGTLGFLWMLEPASSDDVPLGAAAKTREAADPVDNFS